MFLNTKLSKRFGDASSVTRVHPQSAQQSAQQSIDAQSLEPQSLAPTSNSAAAEPPPRQADLLYCNDIEPREVEWLWQDRLAAGSLAVLSGDPGAGKTWVALAIAAALSKGQNPGETPPLATKPSRLAPPSTPPPITSARNSSARATSASGAIPPASSCSAESLPLPPPHLSASTTRRYSKTRSREPVPGC